MRVHRLGIIATLMVVFAISAPFLPQVQVVLFVEISFRTVVMLVLRTARDEAISIEKTRSLVGTLACENRLSKE